MFKKSPLNLLEIKFLDIQYVYLYTYTCIMYIYTLILRHTVFFCFFFFFLRKFLLFPRKGPRHSAKMPKARDPICVLQVRSVEDVLEVGQMVQVLCLGRDNRGFVKVSMKALEARPEEGAPPPS
jgi:hypothetical protein